MHGDASRITHANDRQVNHDQTVRPAKIHSYAHRHSLAIRVSQSSDEDS